MYIEMCIVSAYVSSVVSVSLFRQLSQILLYKGFFLYLNSFQGPFSMDTVCFFSYCYPPGLVGTFSYGQPSKVVMEVMAKRASTISLAVGRIEGS